MKVPIWCLNHMPVVLDGTPFFLANKNEAKANFMISPHILQMRVQIPLAMMNFSLFSEVSDKYEIGFHAYLGAQ